MEFGTNQLQTSSEPAIVMEFGFYWDVAASLLRQCSYDYVLYFNACAMIMVRPCQVVEDRTNFTLRLYYVVYVLTTFLPS